jgi:hypothetical protein
MVSGLLAGCSGHGERAVNDVQRMEMIKQDVAGQIKAKGGEAEKRTYRLGEGWAVKLANATIDDEVIGLLKQLNHVAELDLSGSTVTDEQMNKIAREAGGVLHKLNISNTQLTDAVMDALADRIVLGELVATGSKITQAGVAKFKSKRQANPNVRIKNTVVKL